MFSVLAIVRNVKKGCAEIEIANKCKIGQKQLKKIKSKRFTSAFEKS